MDEHTQLEGRVQIWTAAGLIDADAAARILAFESGRERKATLRWPVFVALAFGGILLAAGVTLFVAAHWNELSPTARFTLVLMMVGVFHIGGALLADRFPPFSMTLHGIGTATLGAAIFLTAQIFSISTKIGPLASCSGPSVPLRVMFSCEIGFRPSSLLSWRRLGSSANGWSRSTAASEVRVPWPFV